MQERNIAEIGTGNGGMNLTLYSAETLIFQSVRRDGRLYASGVAHGRLRDSSDPAVSTDTIYFSCCTIILPAML